MGADNGSERARIDALIEAYGRMQSAGCLTTGIFIGAGVLLIVALIGCGIW